MMLPRTLLHLSDLHLGRSASDEAHARAFVARVVAEKVNHVVITGDVSNRGKREELALYLDIFAPLLRNHQLTVVPGNHDRLGHDVATDLRNGPRVQTATAPGLFLVRFDSTGPHNRSWLSGHGAMSMTDIEAILAAVQAAPAGHMVALLLHHHPLPLPEDNTAELLSSWLGWRWTAELDLGWTLLRALAGRCDLVLHGHRHQPRAFRLFEDGSRPLHLFNAGSSTELGAARLFRHHEGRLVEAPVWWRDQTSRRAAQPTWQEPPFQAPKAALRT